MIAVSDQLRALLTSNGYQRADLYTIALRNGVTLYLTSWQVAIASGGNTFVPFRIGGDRKWKVSLGLETDSYSITVGIDPTNELQINGVPFRQAARAGFLSGAQLDMQWAYLDAGVLVGTLPRFSGMVGQVMPDRLGAKLTVNSPLKLLDMQLPARIYGPRCPWTLGDANCGVDLPSFAVTGTAAAGGTQGTINCSLGQATNYFQLGIVTFTSGKNAGLKRQVRSSSPGRLILATPLPFAPAAGDTLSATPGCDHTAPAAVATATISHVPPIQVQPAGRGIDAVVKPAPGTIKVQIANGVAGFQDAGVVYSGGVHDGQALTKIDSGLPHQDQYAVSGNTYTFINPAAAFTVKISFLTTALSTNATCQTVFNNAARNGATPFVPQPEVAY